MTLKQLRKQRVYVKQVVTKTALSLLQLNFLFLSSRGTKYYCCAPFLPLTKGFEALWRD